MTTQPPPRPTDSETFEQYSVRASKALFRAVPDHRERNRAIRQTWHHYRGPTAEEQQAAEAFSADKYECEEDVCIFAEHETVDSEGEPRRYGLSELAGIVRECNERMRERQAFPALADRHTPGPNEPNPVEPRVLGYGGPVRLGLIGRDQPQWAIFADEYRYPHAAPVFAQKNRRSVELWTDKRTGRAWFDPITLCGADAPRLPLPAQYQQVTTGSVTLERYTCAGTFASPGATSTYVPSADDEPDRYGDESGEPPGAQPMTPEDLKQIIDALLETPHMKWVAEQMQSDTPGPGGMSDLPPGEGEEPPMGAPAGGPPIPDAAPGGNDLDELMGGGPPPPTPAGPPGAGGPPPTAGEDEKEKFSMHSSSPTVTLSREQYTALRSENASLRNSQQALIADHGRNLARLDALEHSATDTIRRGRLQTLAADRPSIDVEAECAVTLYSLGANMSDDAFDQHLATLERAAPPQVEQTRLPTGGTPPPRNETEAQKYEQKRQALAVRIATQHVDATGNAMPWTEAVQKAEEKLTAETN